MAPPDHHCGGLLHRPVKLTIPSSGMMRISEDERPKVDVQVVSSARVAPGSYAIPIRFQLAPSDTLRGAMFTETIVEVKVGGNAANTGVRREEVR